MTVLFDTNVIVEIEGPYKALSSTIADMVRTAHEVNCDIVVHPSQIDDLNRDADLNRRTIQLSRIMQYPMLDNLKVGKHDHYCAAPAAAPVAIAA